MQTCQLYVQGSRAVSLFMPELLAGVAPHAAQSLQLRLERGHELFQTMFKPQRRDWDLVLAHQHHQQLCLPVR